MAGAQTSRQLRSVESGRVDVVVHQLVSLVLAPDWAPETAAAQIAAHAGGDRRLLRLARLRVWRAATHPRSRVTTRAHVTIDLAIEGDHATGEVAACRS